MVKSGQVTSIALHSLQLKPTPKCMPGEDLQASGSQLSRSTTVPVVNEIFPAMLHARSECQSCTVLANEIRL